METRKEGSSWMTPLILWGTSLEKLLFTIAHLPLLVANPNPILLFFPIDRTLVLFRKALHLPLGRYSLSQSALNGPYYICSSGKWDKSRYSLGISFASPSSFHEHGCDVWSCQSYLTTHETTSIRENVSMLRKQKGNNDKNVGPNWH